MHNIKVIRNDIEAFKKDKKIYKDDNSYLEINNQQLINNLL